MPNRPSNPFVQHLLNDELNIADTVCRIDQGLIFIQDIEILRKQAGEEYDLSDAGLYAYHLYIDTLREAVQSLDVRAHVKEVSNG